MPLTYHPSKYLAYKLTRRRNLFDAQDEIDSNRERLIEKTEGKLKSESAEEAFFTIRWNYLSEGDIKKLERTVSAFFDYIEGIIERRQTFTMAAFAESLNKFLTFNEYQVLENFGSVKRTAAEAKAAAEYEKFNRTQKLESDFDKSVKQLTKKRSPNQ
ncbi:MAG: RhuM family protein [Lamprobacter sp.]|uniref:RhuM family protein n=1 Tax=Lamprobacter sp. TaxID=3100796 RepID=UPI002B262E12|nr:RhuM family protein [Lamprobacter sp.]MEA3644089.1 RhuM family protein [Lamprobacter sp.]